ncbi:TolC family outer membrane protein [Granulosicoccus antarcticus]|uniref:Outer membrane protein TolC n=1 Tax=Granulosicoccus antarcticus IMCC3135 TaxID=1192854 RepID=A0A2Z2NJC0_9GAMM|nr:TolC family outer membrane protein [Granulosicoccus antarcticus]ASJ71482.1 Outer membrane protein TolC [Granulosicoccus antarcticus IMCC3135]
MTKVNLPSTLSLSTLALSIRAARTTLIAAPLLFASAAQAVDLQEVYEQAREYDAEYSASQYDLEAARERIPLARSTFRPQLTFGGEAGISTLADDGEGPYNETALSLSLSQTLFNRSGSKLLDQAELNVMQAEAQYAALGQTLILRVATAYFDVLRADANVEFSQSELEAISRQLEQAERRFDVGLVPITDVRSAQAQYDLAVAQEIAAANQLSTAQEALVLISGQTPETLAPLAEDSPLLPPDPANIDAWVDMAVDQNLELVIARLSDDSSQMQVDIERAERYPTLDLVGSAASSTTDQINRSDADVAEIKLQLVFPILTGGLVNAQVAQARALSLSSGEQLLAQQRATIQQTRDGYRGVQASISLVKAFRQALESTQKSAEATEAGFRAGTRTSVEVLQALRDTFSARSDYAGARYDYIINSLNLKAAAGTLSEDDIYSINLFLGEVE